jgi:hypothetical protein
METTINQIQKLEKYLITTRKNVDKVFSNSISKIYNRELKKSREMINSLELQLKIFEKKYNLKTKTFIKKYESGDLGDDIDFVEWSATHDMWINACKEFQILVNK